jgi:aldose sugar dehydrogenase
MERPVGLSVMRAYPAAIRTRWENLVTQKLIALLAVSLGATLGVPAPTSAQPTVVSDRNVPIEPGARRETVTEGLVHPWGMAWLPDGAMLVTERPGRLRMVRDGRLVPEPISGVPDVLVANQGGLLDVSVHPKFSENRYVYLTYAHGTTSANRTRLARAKLSPTGEQLTDVTVLFEVSQAKPGAQHFGSRITWLPDDTLLMTVGDGGNAPNSIEGRLSRDYAQDLNSHIGKVIRLRDDGSIPADNPFFGKANARAEVWSYGHRNSQGIAYDTIRRTIWANEHGSLGGDELNRLSKGANYGWPIVSRTRDYRTGQAISPAQSAPGIVDPVLLWEVSVAPSGLAVYDHTAFPQWRGDLFSGSLVSLDVRRLDLDADGKIVGETALRVGQRVRDVRVGPDGFLYVLTDEQAGRLLRYRPNTEQQTAPIALTGAAPPR